MKNQHRALVEAQPIGRIIRRGQLAELANHSTDWVDRQARLPNPVLVAVRNANGRVMGFTEASVRRLLGCEAVTTEATNTQTATAATAARG